MEQQDGLNLTIDAGNTRIKAALFQEDTLVRHTTLTADTLRQLSDFCDGVPLRQCAISNVAADAKALDGIVGKFGIPLRHVDGTTPTPLRNCYRTPQTLGADRWAAAVGARSLQPHGALLIIDSGTCVKYDFVDAENRYWGGNISPGLEMRLKAMHEHTARLPLVKAAGECPLLGHDTETALRAGASHGLRLEIEGYIRHFSAREDRITLFMTGGQTLGIDSDIPCLTDKHLVMRGLNSILRHTYEP